MLLEESTAVLLLPEPAGFGPPQIASITIQSTHSRKPSIMPRLTRHISVPDEEVEISATGSGGPGGQHVNKAATAVHLRFDIANSSLPERYKSRLLAMRDRRITREGVVVIKAQEHRSREKNEQSALERLGELVEAAGAEHKARRPTRPSKRARARRTDTKKQRGRTKALRKPPSD